MRAFISLNLPEEIKENIRKIQNEVKEKIGGKNARNIKWENPDKFHMTLFFLGDVSDEKAERISLLLGKVPEKINGGLGFEGKEISAFPNMRFPRVLTISLENADGRAFRLHEEVCLLLKEEGFIPDKKFHPHITLGRVRRDTKVFLEGIQGEIIFSINFILREFFLMQSVLRVTGSEYTELKKFGLIQG